MTIAFFDLDKTLLSVNSARLWIKNQSKNNAITSWQMLKFSYGLLRYYFGSANIETQINEAILLVKGKKETELLEEMSNFYHQEVKKNYRPGAMITLEKHRSKSDRLVLLTSCPQPLAILASQDLRLDDCLSTQFAVDTEGCYTGLADGQICYGEGKAKAAITFATKHQVPLHQCFFYTDSITDLPALALVGNPVAVNPDPRLNREAIKNQWPIVDWGKPHVTKNN